MASKREHLRHKVRIRLCSRLAQEHALMRDLLRDGPAQASRLACFFAISAFEAQRGRQQLTPDSNFPWLNQVDALVEASPEDEAALPVYCQFTVNLYRDVPLHAQLLSWISLLDKDRANDVVRRLVLSGHSLGQGPVFIAQGPSPEDRPVARPDAAPLAPERKRRPSANATAKGGAPAGLGEAPPVQAVEAVQVLPAEEGSPQEGAAAPQTLGTVAEDAPRRIQLRRRPAADGSNSADSSAGDLPIDAADDVHQHAPSPAPSGQAAPSTEAGGAVVINTAPLAPRRHPAASALAGLLGRPRLGDGSGHPAE